MQIVQTKQKESQGWNFLEFFCDSVHVWFAVAQGGSEGEEVGDSLYLSQLMANTLVAAALILAASLAQGSCSQVQGSCSQVQGEIKRTFF